MVKKVRKLVFFSRKKSETLFMIFGALFPLLQFILFYVCVNGNQIILAFKRYDDSFAVFAGFENFKNVINDMLYDVVMKKALLNSVICFGVTFLTIVLSILLAFFWWKQVWTSGFIKILALLPNLLSVSVFVMIYRYTVIDFLPSVFNNETLGELLLPPKSLWTVLTIGFILGFGPQSILFFGAMNGVSQDVVEYAKIDGFGVRHEFFKLILPAVYPTFISYTVIGLAGFFTNYGLIFTFFNTSADYAIRTVGYSLFVKIYTAVGYHDYPYVAASGIIFTLITVPVIFIVKAVLEKVGPKEE